MNLKHFLRFFVIQSLILLTDFRYVEAFSLQENREPIITTPLGPSITYVPYKALLCNPFVTFAEAKGFFAMQNLEVKIEGLFSKMEALLSPLAFSLLFFLMLAYWSQAAFFGQEKYKTLNNFIFFLAMASLSLLLVSRWIISRHFPLSNLYESLVFLSLCFLSLKAFFLPRRKPLQKANAQHLNPVVQNKKFNKLIRSETKQSVVNEACTNLQFAANSEPKQSFGTKSLSDLTSPNLLTLLTSTNLREQSKASPSGTYVRRFVLVRKGHQIYDLLGHVRNQRFVKRFVSEKRLQISDLFASDVRHERPKHQHFVPTIEKKADILSLGLGVILSPLSLLTFGFAFLSLPKEMQQSTALVPALQSNWLMMHVTVMILSYAALISGSILAIAFLILKAFESPYILDGSVFFDKANAKQILTPEEKMLSTKLEDSSLTVRLDNYSYRILALGFPLLTIGILSGAVWANEAWGSYWSWDPKETWALITWLVFAIYLHTRITKGWSGKKPAIVASAGFFMVWFCYLGVNLLGTGLHSYGWFTG